MSGSRSRKMVVDVTDSDNDNVPVASTVLNPATSPTLVPGNAWELSFNLGCVLDRIVLDCLQVAPFLNGSSKAVYDAKFFHKLLGLYGHGLKQNHLTEAKCPREWYESGWPPEKGQFHFNDCQDPELEEQARAMYARVYGGPPNNGGISAQFLRGIVLYWKQGLEVNWAD
jgi:hypothetical protein